MYCNIEDSCSDNYSNDREARQRSCGRNICNAHDSDDGGDDADDDNNQCMKQRSHSNSQNNTGFPRWKSKVEHNDRHCLLSYGAPEDGHWVALSSNIFGPPGIATFMMSLVASQDYADKL